MSRSWSPRAGSLRSRVLCVPLRLKVMAGVVAVTLLALAAFDVGAVITMRRYLLAQTDNSLQQALSVTLPQLKSLVSGASRPDGAQLQNRPHYVQRPGTAVDPARRRPRGTRRPATRASTPLPGSVGDYEIVLVPLRGPMVTLETEVGSPAAQQFLSSLSSRPAGFPAPSAPARALAQPGLRTALIGSVPFRILSAPAPGGGSLIVATSLAQVTETTGQVETIVVVGSLAVVLLIGLGVFVVMRRGLRPIEAMARQADRITGGDLTDRVAAHDRRSEVGRLGAALNGMLARLETNQQQMRRFFADASHELRTPLASLRANAQLYQQGAVQGPGEADEVMDRIVVETRRMGQLVDDMLRLARLGQHPSQSGEPVDLTALVTRCAERVQVAGPGRAWQVRIAAGLTVTGDEELLRRAIDNLLMNVLVHTPADATGAISASAARDWVTIEVSDDGPGVPPDHLPHIFERFYRGETRSVSGSGSGLGLAIAAETISAHGGTTHATPVSPHGLRITLTLPARPDPRSAPELAASAGSARSQLCVNDRPSA
jgi:two-component system, OmpR family, sensor kinase